MFGLKNLADYNDFTIQCHDNPDADAIASAFALYSYFKYIGKTAKIIYSGKFEITKANLLEMIIQLDIPIEYVTSSENISVLITVDCQYSAGNVARIEAEKVVVIDHHKEEKTFNLGVINSSLGSCSTLVWDLLRKENFPFEKYPDVSTALYYGLFTDTGSLAEIYHPLDKDMRDILIYSKSIVKRLQNTNLSLNELSIAGGALINCNHNHELRFATLKSEPCDPNILGFISDLALQVDGVDTCVVYNILPDGAKLSIRCCARDVMASDFAEYLTRGVGSGGGHLDKAGGFIVKAKVEAAGQTLDEYIHAKTLEYFNSYDIVDATSHNLDVGSMARHKKLKLTVGYARSTDMFEAGTPLMIRALEGEENVTASDDIYFMVGILGEIYPIKKEKFERSYIEVKKDFDIKIDALNYSPTARNIITGEINELAEFIRPCTSLGDSEVFAKPLERNTKVFTIWNLDSYMYGREGDYIVVRADSYNDVYIIRNDIFNMTYEAVRL